MVTDRQLRQLATGCVLLLALGLGACSGETKPTDSADTGSTESTPTVEHTGEYTGCRGGTRATDSGGSGSDSGGSGATGAPPRAHTGYYTGC